MQTFSLGSSILEGNILKAHDFLIEDVISSILQLLVWGMKFPLYSHANGVHDSWTWRFFVQTLHVITLFFRVSHHYYFLNDSKFFRLEIICFLFTKMADWAYSLVYCNESRLNAKFKSHYLLLSYQQLIWILILNMTDRSFEIWNL